MKINRCFYKPEIRTSSDEKRTTIRFTTGEVDRHRTIVNPDGIDFTHYMRNPIVKWQHGNDPQRGNLPIAKTMSIERDGDGYVAEIEWYSDSFSENIMRMMKGGFLSMASLSWIPEETSERDIEGMKIPVFDRSEMTEFSIVDIGSNRGSLVVERDASDSASLEVQNRLLEAVERLETSVSALSHARQADEAESNDGQEVTPPLAPEGSDDAGNAGPSAPDVPGDAQPKEPEAAPADRAIPKPKGMTFDEALAFADDFIDRKLGRK